MRDGLGLAAGQKAFDQQNALAELYKTQGANIMAGDQNALNALAQFDPTAALGIQSQHQQNAYATEDQQRQRETARREGERYAKEVGAEQAAAEAAELEAAVKQALAAPSPEAFDAMMTQMGRPEMVGQFENREMLAIPFLGMAEGMKLAAGPEAPEWRAATPEEAAANGAVAGQVNTKTGKFDAQNPPSGMSLTTNPDGTMTLEQGPGVTGAGHTGKPTEGSLASEGYLQRMQGAEEIFTQLESAGTAALGYTDLPVVDSDLETWKLTQPEQMLLQAQRDWVRAKLRKESGAVIGPEEMAAEIRQYFPQPGNGPDVIAQKKEARKRAEEQLRITALLPAAPEAPAAGEATISTDAEYDALPSGAVFVGPDGVKRRKP
jgi:hypothetical protein